MSWDEMRLDDFLTLKRGYDLPAAQRKDGFVPIVSSSGITGRHNIPKVHGPGVVTGRYGTLGEVFYVSEDFWPLNTSLYVQNFKGNDRRFTAYFLKTILRAQSSDKAAVPGVNRNDLHARKVVVTKNQSEQSAIVEILSAYDDLIENNQRRIELLEQAVRELYKEWFVRFRFPGHEHVKIVDGVPEGWKRVTLSDVATTNMQSYTKRNLPETIQYVDISSVSQGAIALKTPYAAADAPGRARRIAKHGDTIWSNVRPNLRAYALVMEPGDTDVFSTGFTVLSAKSVPYSFLHEFVTTDKFVAHLVNHATGASYPAVRPPDFDRAELVVPLESMLEQFHSICDPIFLKICLLQKQSAAASQARDLLLPKLMSGMLAT